MSDSKRRRTTFRPEALGLEGRNLLSAGLSAQGIHAAAAVHHGRPVVPGPAVAVVFVRANASGVRASDPLYSPAGPAFAGYSGTGNAGVFGPVLFGTEVRPVATSTTTAVLANGTALMTTLKGGNQLRLAYSGTATTRANGATVWNIAGNIVGGTGRFDLATGTFTGNATAVHGQGFRISLQLRFNPPV